MTSSRWRLHFSSLEFPRHHLLNLSNYVGRRAQHILNATVKGGVQVGPSTVNRDRKESKSKGNQPRIYLPGDLLPAGKTDIVVIAPSVFKGSGFTQRSLSDEELLDVYDLQVGIRESIKELLVSDQTRGKELLQTIVESPPGKLTSHVAGAGLKTLIELFKADGALDTTDDVGDPTDTTQDAEEDEIQMIDWLIFEKDHSALNDEKAARDDDQEAEVLQWDNYIVNEYNPDLEWNEMEQLRLISKGTGARGRQLEALICQKGEITEEHSRLFTLLRNTLLNYNKRRLVKSFSAYLKQQYGTKWNEKVSKNKKLRRDLSVGRDVLKRYGKCNWWDWVEGSTLVFWRWHPSVQKFA